MFNGTKEQQTAFVLKDDYSWFSHLHLVKSDQLSQSICLLCGNHCFLVVQWICDLHYFLPSRRLPVWILIKVFVCKVWMFSKVFHTLSAIPKHECSVSWRSFKWLLGVSLCTVDKFVSFPPACDLPVILNRVNWLQKMYRWMDGVWKAMLCQTNRNNLCTAKIPEKQSTS